MPAGDAMRTRYTPDDLLGLPDGKSYELVNGELLERYGGARYSLVGGEVFLRLFAYCENRALGLVWPSDNGYECFPHAPNTVRKPRVSFIRADRMTEDRIPNGWVTIPPDLAVEVVTPDDMAEQLEAKVADYRRVHVPLIWVIYPDQRKVRVFRHNGPITDLHEDDELSGEDVIPGFCCRLRDILPTPPESAEDHDQAAGPNGSGPA